MVANDKSNTEPQADGAGTATASRSRFRKYLVYIIAFWAAALLLVLIVRYPVIVGLLLSGNNDRPLLAVESAVIEGEGLTVTFIRGVPDEPTELFILSGAFPQHSSSDSNLINRIDKGNIYFNDDPYEVLHRAVGGTELAKGTLSDVKYTINWISQEQGVIKLNQLGNSLVDHVKTGKAFLLVTNGENTFAAAAFKY